MSDLSTLGPNSWFTPASLLIQLAFLVAGVWFARNILKTMRAFQEQIGALLKLSITAVPADRNLPASAVPQSLAESSPYWLAPSDPEAAVQPQSVEHGPGRITVARRKMFLWLQAPMTTTQPAHWRRVISWLQAPARS